MMEYRVPIQSFGPPMYSPTGELYNQIPRSLMGRLSRRAQIVLDAIYDFIGNRSCTDATDRAFQQKTGLNPRTIQRALKDLEREGIEAIKRTRAHGRRLIEMIKRIRDAGPRQKAPAVKQPAPQAPAPAQLGGMSAAIERQLHSARQTVDAMALCGYEPRIVEGKLKWHRLSPGERELTPELKARCERYAADIRKLVELTRPARE
jgi:hypothetical protein